MNPSLTEINNCGIMASVIGAKGEQLMAEVCLDVSVVLSVTRKVPCGLPHLHSVSNRIRRQANYASPNASQNAYFVLQGEAAMKKAGGLFGGLFGTSTDQLEDAADKFTRAGNAFKATKRCKVVMHDALSGHR